MTKHRRRPVADLMGSARQRLICLRSVTLQEVFLTVFRGKRTVPKTRHIASQKVAYYMPKGYLLQCNMPPFKIVSAVFWNAAGLQFLFQGFGHLGVFGVGKVFFLRVHAEHSSEIGASNVLGHEVEMQVRQRV